LVFFTIEFKDKKKTFGNNQAIKKISRENSENDSVSEEGTMEGIVISNSFKCFFILKS
jgi:hypothetical protein